MKRKVFAVLLLCAASVLFYSCGGSKYAEYNTGYVRTVYMYVQSDALNIRSQPSAKGSLVKTVKKHDRLEVADSEESWVAVYEHNRKVGYVNKSYLSYAYDPSGSSTKNAAAGSSSGTKKSSSSASSKSPSSSGSASKSSSTSTSSSSSTKSSGSTASQPSKSNTSTSANYAFTNFVLLDMETLKKDSVDSSDFALAGAYIEYEEYDSAIEIYSSIISNNVKCYEAYNNRGVVYYKTGDLNKAFDDFSSAARVSNNKSYKVLYNLGVAYTMKKSYDKALSNFNMAIQLNDSYANLYAARGTAYALSGNKADAEKDFKQALNLDGNNAAAKKNLNLVK